MVTRWGLSDRLGPLSYGEEEGEVFLGHSVTRHKNVSDETAHAIDEEIRTIVDRNYQRAHKILDEHTDCLHTMADALMKYETIDAKQIDDIMAGKEPRPPSDWNETEPPSGTGQETGEDTTDTVTGSGESDDGTIGGPASQH
jgi:cell division protease FtsH